MMVCSVTLSTLILSLWTWGDKNNITKCSTRLYCNWGVVMHFHTYWYYICCINNHQWSGKLLNMRFFSNLIKSILTHFARRLAQLTSFLLLNEKGSVGWMNHMLPWTSPHTTKSEKKKITQSEKEID